LTILDSQGIIIMMTEDGGMNYISFV
jgi:hypothetical protein